MLSLLSSCIIFAQTEQTKSTRVFSFLALRTDNNASFSKYFSTRCMSTISSSLAVSDILPTGKMSLASLTVIDVEREPSIILSFSMGRSLQNGSTLSTTRVSRSYCHPAYSHTYNKEHFFGSLETSQLTFFKIACT